MKNGLNTVIIALNRISGVSKRKSRLLLDNIKKRVKNIEDIDFGEAIRIGIDVGIFQKNQPVGFFLDAYNHAQKVLEICKKENIKIINIFSDYFPKALSFDNSPYIFYYKGNLQALENKNRATVVGTRHPSSAGSNFAYDISKELVENGYTVISGLALGCDTAAHNACIQNKGQTVAFLPSSLSNINPNSNKALAQEIINHNGLVITEFSPLATSNANMYITRDRFIAGATNLVFASEFDEQSGTLQTLEFASKFNKPIYTLKELVKNKEFNGFESLESKKIKCEALDWNELKKIIKSSKIH